MRRGRFGWPIAFALLGALLLASAAAEAKPQPGFDIVQHRGGVLLFDVGYANSLVSNVASGSHGLYVNIGLNPGRIIHKRLLIGFYWGVMSTWGGRYNKAFHQDFADHFDPRMEMVSEQALGAYDEGAMYGDVKLSLGVAIKLWQYIPLIKIYLCHSAIDLTQGNSTEWTGSTTVGGITYNSYSSGTGAFWSRNGWGVELVICGFTTQRRSPDDPKRIDLAVINFATIALYADFSSLKRSKLDEFPTYLYVEPAFLDDHAREVKVGLKIGVLSWY